MSAPDFHALAKLQNMRFERAASAYAALSTSAAQLRGEIDTLREHIDMSQLSALDGPVLQKYLNWRNQRMRDLNMKLARIRAEMEDAKALVRREFGRSEALKLLDQK